MTRSTQILLVLAALLWQAASAAETDATPTDSQQEARALLMGMAEFLAGREAFNVKLLAGYDVVQEDGQKIEFLEARELTLERPDHLLIEERVGADGGNTVLFDGKTMTVWDATAGVYAQVEQPGSIDHAIIYFVRDLGMRLPLAPLLITGLPAELKSRVHAVDYVEFTEVLGEPAHHIAGRTDTVQFQAWIADGERPLLLRIVLTYEEAGQPQYWAQFSGWNLKPRLHSGTFAFKPKAEARRIVFAAQLPAGPAPAEPEAKPAQEMTP